MALSLSGCTSSRLWKLVSDRDTKFSQSHCSLVVESPRCRKAKVLQCRAVQATFSDLEEASSNVPILDSRSTLPPGLYRYESMVVVRPDLTEEQRVAFTERYEEALIAGGAMDVEMFNRGMQPLAYSVRKKNMGGVLNQYLDGIYLLFTYVTKPESQLELQEKFKRDDDIIRATTFRVKS